MFIHFKSTQIKSISISSGAKVKCKLKLVTDDNILVLDISSNDQLLSHKATIKILEKTFSNVEYPIRNDDA